MADDTRESASLGFKICELKFYNSRIWYDFNTNSQNRDLTRGALDLEYELCDLKLSHEAMKKIN